MSDEELPMDGSEESEDAPSADETAKGAIADLLREAGQSEEVVDLLNGKSALDLITEERDEYLDTLRRLQAEFDNYRKRMTRQQSELLERASVTLVERLLPVLDALDLAVAHLTGQEDDQATSALVQIAGLARTTLEKEGLERIDETGVDFDPTIHDAVSHVESGDEGGHEPKVVNVMRAGYRLKGQIIRPAMVAVQG